MEKYLELAKILNNFFDISGSVSGKQPFTLNKLEHARLLEILLTKKTEYWEVNLNELYNDIKKK